MSSYGPPRMIILSAAEGSDIFVRMPENYKKAMAAAMVRFNIPAETHYARLSVRAVDLPWVGGYEAKKDVFIADNDSYRYACTGKHFARFKVHVYVKNKSPSATSSSGSANGDKQASAKPKPAEPPLPSQTSDLDVISADSEITCMTLKGTVTLADADQSYLRRVGWSTDWNNKKLFRVIEYGAMEVHDV
ncbi:hypothetical protein IAR50_007034 [Cryptococcus sp. DSM 104548]